MVGHPGRTPDLGAQNRAEEAPQLHPPGLTQNLRVQVTIQDHKPAFLG